MSYTNKADKKIVDLMRFKCRNRYCNYKQ